MSLLHLSCPIIRAHKALQFRPAECGFISHIGLLILQDLLAVLTIPRLT